MLHTPSVLSVRVSVSSPVHLAFFACPQAKHHNSPMVPSLYSFMTLSFSTSILYQDALCCPAPFPLPPFCPVKVILPLLLTDFPACDRFSFFSSILLFPHVPPLLFSLHLSLPPPLPATAAVLYLDSLPPSSSPPYCSIPPPCSFPPPMVIKQCPHLTSFAKARL